MKIKFAIITFLLILACQDIKRPEKPDNLIGKDKMVEILTDAYLSNAARSVDNKSLRRKGVRLDSLIYTKHNIDSIQFANSNSYYTSNIKTYNEIFLKVEERLLAMKVMTDSVMESKTGLEKEEDTLSSQPKLVDPIKDEEDQASIE